MQALRGEPITLYGDGKQGRDLLFVQDLVNAFELALKNIDSISGRAFNMGGGPRNAASLLEVLETIEKLDGKRPAINWGDWRPGDQNYYVSDTRAFEKATGWKAHTDVSSGIAKLHQWFMDEGIEQPRTTPATTRVRDEVLAA